MLSLQAKDKVIASLRDGSKGEVASGISSSEYEEVCHERDMLKDEVNQFKYRMEQLKADLQVTIANALQSDGLYRHCVFSSYQFMLQAVWCGCGKRYPLHILPNKRVHLYKLICWITRL